LTPARANGTPRWLGLAGRFAYVQTERMEETLNVEPGAPNGESQQPAEAQRGFAMDVAANVAADVIVAGLTAGGRYIANKIRAESPSGDGSRQPPEAAMAPDDGGFLDE